MRENEGEKKWKTGMERQTESEGGTESEKEWDAIERGKYRENVVKRKTGDSQKPMRTADISSINQPVSLDETGWERLLVHYKD